MELWEETEGKDSESEPVENICIDGRYYTNEELLNMVLCEVTKSMKTNRFLNKVRRYLKSVSDSGGFDITDWPGPIWGLTTVEPRSRLVIDCRYNFPEAFKFGMLLARKAIANYKKDNNTLFKVDCIEKVNSRMLRGYAYWITFSASFSDQKCTFQAFLWANLTHREIQVISCKLKPGCGAYSSTDSVPKVAEASLDDKSIIGSRSQWSREHLWELYLEGNRVLGVSDELKDNILKEIYSYLKSIEDSEGFECTDFTRRIPRLTTVEPRQEIIDWMSYHFESYHYVFFMAAEAIEVYNRENETQYHFMRLNSVNSLLANGPHSYYYITFVAAELTDYIESTFQAKVSDKMSEWRVEFCRLKPGASSETTEGGGTCQASQASSTRPTARREMNDLEIAPAATKPPAWKNKQKKQSARNNINIIAPRQTSTSSKSVHFPSARTRSAHTQKPAAIPQAPTSSGLSSTGFERPYGSTDAQTAAKRKMGHHP